MPRINILSALQQASQLHSQQRFAEAERLYRQVLSIDKNNPDALHLLGVLLHQTGRTDEGIQSIRRAIARDPRAAEFHLNLANIQAERGQPGLAADSLRKAIELEPRGAVDARIRLARFLNAELNRPSEAVQVLRQALAIQPANVEALNDLAVALHRAGDRAAAVEYYNQAIALTPNDVDLLCNYATTLTELGHYDRALEFFQCALELQPRHEKSWYNLGLAHVSQERFEEAIAAFKKALEINPQHARAKFQLAVLLCAGRELEESADLYAQSLTTPRERADVYLHAGLARMNEGRNDKAIELTRRALAIDPDYELAWHNLMMGLNYNANDDAQLMLSDHQAWGRRHQDRYPAPPHTNDPSPERRLRIGYISPDFRLHSVANFIEPVLAQHDAGQVDVFCYSNNPRNDAITERLKGYAHHWREIRGQSDDAVAELIRQDQIDILIDLALHTADNRLLVLARKPAPLQGTWLGYASTSGLKAIDFRLTDAWIDPPETSDQFSVERLIRLPQTQWVYRPLTQTPDITPLPAEKNGTITFGVATNLAKLNEPTVDLWSQILHQIPGSTLVIKASGLRDPQSAQALAPSRLARYGSDRVWQQLRTYLCDLLARAGVSEDRLRLEGTTALLDYLNWFSGIDIVLDTFPFAGGTTTCHALYMGVPVVTRTGHLSVSRVGSSILHNVGLANLVAQTPEDFVNIAVKLAQDLPRLADLRRTLRDRMRQSPLMNEPQFVKNLESTNRELWRTWCAARSPTVV